MKHILSALNDASTAATELAAAAPLVLVVDDSLVDRRVAGALLTKKAGVRVAYACNGEAALESMGRETPDLVVTDMQMPEMDGLALVESVRTQYPHVPTILMTAHGSEDTALQALRRGAANYVPKRELARDLAGTVAHVLAMRRSLSEQTQAFAGCWSGTEFRFEMDNDDALISVVVAHLQHYAAPFCGRDPNEQVRVGVALHEALRNAMQHGNLELDSELRQDDSRKYYELLERRRGEEPYKSRRVHMTARESLYQAEYVIRDEGPGFDFQAVWRDPTDAAHLEKPTGRGLFLIRMFMDEVHFNAAGNEIRMVHCRTRSGGGTLPKTLDDAATT